MSYYEIKPFYHNFQGKKRTLVEGSSLIKSIFRICFSFKGFNGIEQLLLCASLFS